MLNSNEKIRNEHMQYANDLFRYFITNGYKYYGNTFTVYNVHSIIHLADDLDMGCSSNEIPAFPFENYLQKLKKCVKKW